MNTSKRYCPGKVLKWYRKTTGKDNKKIGVILAMALFMAIARVACPGTVPTVLAKTTRQKLEDAKEERKDLQNELEDKKDDIEDLNSIKAGLQNKLGNLNSQLQNVSNKLETIEGNITDKEAEIEHTIQMLNDAIATQDSQYAAMKKRVQFFYENQQFNMLDFFFGKSNYSGLLNNSLYAQELSAYDRKQLVLYMENVRKIKETKARLEEERAELQEMQKKHKSEQSRVSGLVASTSNSISDYSSAIDTAMSEAEAKEAEIAQKDADIEALKKKLEEEIRLSKLAHNSKWRSISEVTFAEGDRKLLANLIYCEAGNQPYAGQLAVGAVVINRVLSSVYPDTVVGVIYQPHQFSPVGSGRLAVALAADKATDACYRAADEAMNGMTNVGDRVYFRTPIPGLKGMQIGGHIFY
jgi:spore germination cell wall hydrolase CwlJ-like protein